MTFGNAAKKRIVREADKIASMKQELDAFSWSRVREIGKYLQAKYQDPALTAWGSELIAIAQSNLSLASQLGIETTSNDERVTASGMGVIEGGLAEAALTQSMPEDDYFEPQEPLLPEVETFVQEVLPDDELFFDNEVEGVAECAEQPALEETPFCFEGPAREELPGTISLNMLKQSFSTQASVVLQDEQPEEVPPGRWEASEILQPAQIADDERGHTGSLLQENLNDTPGQETTEEVVAPLTELKEHPSVSQEHAHAEEAAENPQPENPQPKHIQAEEPFARFRNLYESRDGSLCVFEDEQGHLVAVDASKLA